MLPVKTMCIWLSWDSTEWDVRCYSKHCVSAIMPIMMTACLRMNVYVPASLLVDREMEAQEDYFKAQFPYIENQIDDIEVEYCHDDICSTAMRTRLQQWAQNKHCMLTVAICVHDPDLSLSLGLNLPHEVLSVSVSCANPSGV